MILGQRDVTIDLDIILGFFLCGLRGTVTTTLLILMLKYHNPFSSTCSYKSIKGLTIEITCTKKKESIDLLNTTTLPQTPRQIYSETSKR